MYNTTTLANIPVVSAWPDTSVSATQQAIIAVFLLPPATTPQSRSWFQEQLTAAWITSHFIENRWTWSRREEEFSFTAMGEELAQVVQSVRNTVPNARLVVGASCLSTLSLAHQISKIMDSVDGIIYGIPVASLSQVKLAHWDIHANQLQALYKQYYGLTINVDDLLQICTLNTIEELIENIAPWHPYQPFIYFNNHSWYIDPDTKRLFREWVQAWSLWWIILDPRHDKNNPLCHSIDPEDLGAIQQKTIEYILWSSKEQTVS